ncbi:outer membrane beta-barrel protein [Cellvibrio fibrivorans]|uniref:Outer membrane protein beta-barrel domain-containing protein n=1 Tax=Cellvibrio fibrivorans TaxID=126350 RepID=A0ABU1V352_9GAMM|nr:outer membrane beta-barrel protein [Cellvibrio fibrivorans]MDR7091887.1 hypothetical protein [Cellvibrio fibrivorans]
MFKKAITAAALLCAINVHAADFSYSHFDIGLGKVEIDSDGEEYDGEVLGLGLSVALGNIFYVTADIGRAKIEESTQTTTGLGLGVHAPLGSSTNIYAEAGYARVDIEDGEWSIDDNGTAYTLGLRQQLGEKFELGGGVSRVDVFDSADNSYFIEAFYKAKESVDVGAEISTADDVMGYGVSLRVNF